MAKITIKNQVNEALPAERERGLVGYFDGPFACGTDYYQADFDTVVDGMTIVIEAKSDIPFDTQQMFLCEGLNNTGVTTHPLWFYQKNRLITAFNNASGGTSDGSWMTGNFQFKNFYSATYSNGELKIYFNGDLVDTTTFSARDPILLTGFVVGASKLGTNLFNGTIYSVRVFDTALTQEEIASYSNGTTWNYENQAELVVPMTDAFHVDASNASAVDGTPVVISGATKLTDRRGYAFDGDDYMTIDVSDGRLDGTGDKTFVVMAKQNNEGTEYFFDSEPDRAYLLLYSDGRYQGGMPGSPGAIPFSTWGQYFSRGGFNVFVLRREGGTVSTWVNGTRVSEASVSVGDFDINSVYIGTRATIGANLNGEVNWFGAWNRALTELQIKDLTGKLQRSINET
jgi:hypothetical protein